MEQSQARQTGSIPVDKRTKEYRDMVNFQKESNPESGTRLVDIGFCHFHGPVFFARKNFKEKIDVRSDKGPDGSALSMRYDRDEKEMILRCGDHEAFVPSSNIVSFVPLHAAKKIPLIQPTSNVSANPSINAQVSGPHDHVFAGLGSGQTGVGQKVK